MSILVSIVEDNPQFRATLFRLVDRSPTCRCLGQYGCAEDALLEIPGTRPDVVLMDVNLPGINGVECVRRLKLQLLDIQVIILTVFQDTETIFSALAAGASGYLLKQATPEELLGGIEMIHAGGSPMNSHVARRIVQHFQQPRPKPAGALEKLSPREAQILELLSKGYFYREIAGATSLSYTTVHTHIRHIYKKLQVRSRTEAVAKCLAADSRPDVWAETCPP